MVCVWPFWEESSCVPITVSVVKTRLTSELRAAIAEFLFQGRKAVHCFSVPVTKPFPACLLLHAVPLAFQKLIDLSIL